MWGALVLNICLYAVAGTDDETLIKLPSGTIRGSIQDATRYFRGIPYALPPIGDLRWRPPVPHPGWQGVLNTTEFGASCIQASDGWPTINLTNMSEDCLFVNVYSPSNSDKKKRYPVMVYIHAGEYRYGSSNDNENNWPYFSDEIVLVTINSRLGALGYLASDALRSRSPDNSTGNYGLQDQRLALKWVRENIDYFQGNNSNVLIFGESSGGTNVAAHLTNPRSVGLFDKAVLESPGIFQIKTYEHAVGNHNFIISALASLKAEGCEFLEGQYYNYSGEMIFSYSKAGKRTVKGTDIATAKAECSASDKCSAFMVDSQENTTTFYAQPFPLFNIEQRRPQLAQAYKSFVKAADLSKSTDCLLKTDAKTLVDVQAFLPHDDSFDTDGFAPVMDGVDLKEPIAASIERGQFAPGVPVMAGSNLDEGTEFMSLTVSINCNASHDEFKTWCEEAYGSEFGQQIAELYTNLTLPLPACKDHNYEGIKKSGVQHGYWYAAAMRAATDYGLTCPVRRLTRQLAKAAHPVYSYFFTHTPVYSANMPNTTTMGAFHGAEVPFVFGDKFEIRGEAETLLAKRMGCYWTNFAYNGSPNGQCQVETLPNWSVYTQKEEKKLKLDVGELKEIQDLNKKRCDIFDRVRATAGTMENN